MATIVLRQSQWLSRGQLTLLDLGLSKLLDELAYQKRLLGSGIPDEDVPALRVNCARLALAFQASNPNKKTQAMSEWLALAEGDPLPEMRYLKERYSRD